MPERVRRLLFALVLSLTATAAQAQSWDIEFFGGATAGATPSGETALPPTGAPLTTSNPIFPSRQVSSWFFGDGATLLNDVNASFALAPRISPLDSAFEAAGIGSRSRGLFGVRVRRAVSTRVFAELGFDTTPQRVELSDALADASELTRATFESAFAALLSSGPFSNVSIGATRRLDEGSRRDFTATAAINIHMTPVGSFVPYVTAGGGVIAGTGDLPSLTLEGGYRFTVLNAVTIQESDRVTVRLARDTTFAAIGGAGVRRDVTKRLGIRVDGRILVGPARQRVLVDASPSVVSSTPAGFVESFTHPSVQFSNNASTGRRSSLSGPALQAFQVFESDGLNTRWTITFGVSTRF